MTDAIETTDSLPETKKWALVVTHMLNPNLIQGFPMFADSPDGVRAQVEECLASGWSVPIRNDEGVVMMNIVVGAGMTYQVEDWTGFEKRMADMRAQQENAQRAQMEQQAAVRFGVQPPPNGPRRIR